MDRLQHQVADTINNDFDDPFNNKLITDDLVQLAKERLRQCRIRQTR